MGCVVGSLVGRLGVYSFFSFGNEAPFFPGTFEVRNNEIGRLRYFDNLRTMRNLILKNTSNAINVERSKYLFK